MDSWNVVHVLAEEMGSVIRERERATVDGV